VSGRKTVRDRWYAQVVKTKAINGACRLLLMHVAACHMDETGRIGHMDETTGRFRGVRHEQLAEELGWAGQAAAGQRAVRGGHQGRPAEAVQRGLQRLPDRLRRQAPAR